VSKSKPAHEIPEVAAFEVVAQELDEFKKANTEFFERLEQLVDRYNATLDMAEKACRARQVSCGPFRLTGRPSISYNWAELYEEMGRDWFLEHGGTITPSVIYGGDKAKVELAYASKQLPQEVADKVRAVRCSYHKPNKLVIP